MLKFDKKNLRHNNMRTKILVQQKCNGNNVKM